MCPFRNLTGEKPLYGPKLPIKDTKIIFSAREDDLTLMVIQNQTGVEVITGNP